MRWVLGRCWAELGAPFPPRPRLRETLDEGGETGGRMTGAVSAKKNKIR